MSGKLRLVACLAGAVAPWLIAMTGIAGAAEEQFGVTSLITVPGWSAKSTVSFDIGFVDPVAGVYVLADRTNAAIDVIDTATNNVVDQLKPGFVGIKLNPDGTVNNDVSGPNGVLIVNHTELWVGDGDSTVKVVQLHNGKLMATINTGGKKRADELCYDPNDHIILMANDAEFSDPAETKPAPFVTFISSTTHAILGKITMDGSVTIKGTPLVATNGIEQCQWSPRTGKFYLNIPQVGGTLGANDTPGVVLLIDPVSMKIDETFSEASATTLKNSQCRGNQGMAIGPAPQILLGCSNSGQDSVIINENNGSLVAELSDQSGSDEVWFNAGDDQYFLANGNHKTSGTFRPQLGVVDPGQPNVDSPATSARGSHSVAADPVRNQVYVPVNNIAGQGAASPICKENSADGCIAVFTVTEGTDDPSICIGQGAPVISVANEGTGEPVFLKVVCPPKGNK